jgi:hypothetical protein
VFLSILAAQLIAAARSEGWLRPFMFALPLFFMLIMLADVYLQDAHTSIIFLVFSSVLYRGNGVQNKLPANE